MTQTLSFPSPPHTPGEDFSRADLEFRGVDHSGPSYEARVFLGNPQAGHDTPKIEEAGYAGSFHVFGHGGCFGELGHCDVREGARGPYDRRPTHPLTPQFKTVIVTEALLRHIEDADEEELTVTLVAVVPDNPASLAPERADPLLFESVSLITYEDPVAASGRT